MTTFTPRLSLSAALLSLALSTQAASPAPAAISFDMTPRAGQHQRQQMEMQATMKMRVEAGPEATEAQRAQIAQATERMAQMGAMQMAMQMQQTLQVGQADAEGRLPLTVSAGFSGGQVTMGGKTMPMPKLPSAALSFDARFDPKDFSFEIQKAEGAPELTEILRTQGKSMVNETLQLARALSQHPLKVGDSVDVPLAMNLPVPLPGGAGAMQGLVHYRLTRVDKGIAYFDLGMDLDMSLDVPVPPQPAAAASAASAPDAAASAAPAAADGAAPRAMHLVAHGNGKGHGALRLADRLPLNQQLDMDLQMTLDMPDNGIMHMDMGMTMKSRGESLAKPAAAAKPARPASSAKR